jgi:hypothetical protein
MRSARVLPTMAMRSPGLREMGALRAEGAAGEGETERGGEGESFHGRMFSW